MQVANSCKGEFVHVSRCIDALKEHASQGRFPIYIRDDSTNKRWAIFDEHIWDEFRGEVLKTVKKSPHWAWSPEQRLMLG